MVADLMALEDRGKELKLKKMQLRQLMMLLGEREATPSPRPRESLTLDQPHQHPTDFKGRFDPHNNPVKKAACPTGNARGRTA